MEMIREKICFFGSGNMAEAMIKGLIDKNIISSKNILCVDINIERLRFLALKYGIDFWSVNDSSNLSKLSEASIYFLSVKPLDFIDISKILKPFLNREKFIVSIMAGIRINQIKNELDCNDILQIARVMPNTPALVGEGAIGYSLSIGVNDGFKIILEKILCSIGIYKEVDEIDLDAITALSGSGPAYIFYIAEALIEAGIEMGLSEDVSKVLALQTIYGSALMMNDSLDSVEELRKKVTSKGGTTEAALNFFKENKLKDIIKSGIYKAKEHSIKMSEKK